MKSAEFNKMTGRNLNSLSDAELKSLVKNQGNMANRRYQNIKSRADTNKAGVRSVDKSGGRFSVAGKNRAELLQEAKRIQNFNKMKTGTVRGAQESLQKQEHALKGTTHKQVEKKAAKEIAAEKKREARKVAASKGKKLSKTQRKKIEREARKEAKKKSKQFMQEVSKSYEDMEDELRKEIEEMQSSSKGVTGAESDDIFTQMQDNFYKEMRKEEMKKQEEWFMTFRQKREKEEDNPFI